MDVETLDVEDALEVLADSSVAAFAIDRHDRIVYWNEGAANLLGFASGEALGRLCFDLMRGRDPFGNRYCGQECPIVRGVAEGDVIEPFLLSSSTKAGEMLRLRVRAVALPSSGPGFTCLLHLVESGSGAEMDALEKRLRASTLRKTAPAPPDPILSVSPLTPREREILAQVASGYAALNIAARLNLSHATVRNHIQSILRKMEVHSQVEAVAVAFRRGWIMGG